MIKLDVCWHAGDSHTIALTQRGAVYGWGTYRDATGVYGFAEGHKYALLPTLVREPQKAADQAVKIARGEFWELSCHFRNKLSLHSVYLKMSSPHKALAK